jgi:hypothetical protein
VVILHRGQVVADGRVSELRNERTPTLEGVFAQVTQQEDYSAIATDIVNTVRGR